MRYIELKYRNKTYTNPSEINDILTEQKFYWLIDSEIENARIEIERETLIWHNGSFYNGNWYYGIFKNGKFYGVWENGIWENGEFAGKINRHNKCPECDSRDFIIRHEAEQTAFLIAFYCLEKMLSQN